MKHFIIYAGPSLGKAKSIFRDATKDNILEFRPPAKAGDILNTVIDKPSIDGILLADGFFYENYSPMHREIIYAINSGVKVIGCSSMGAIRAVELEAYGMIGKGDVYKYFKKYPETSDDEVGLIHEKSYPYTPITIPLVNLRILLTKISKGKDKDAIRNSIRYLSTISFDKRFINTNYYQHENITQEQEENLKLAMSLYEDFKINDLANTIEELTRIDDSIEKGQSYRDSDINSLRAYIETGRYQTNQCLISPHRKIGKNENDNHSEIDFRDLLAVGHKNYNHLLTLTAIRDNLLKKAMDQHFEVTDKELGELKVSLINKYKLMDELELGKRLKLTQFELKILLYKEIMIKKMIDAEIKGQQSVLCVGNLMDTLRVSGHYPKEEVLSIMLFKAKNIIKQMNKVMEKNALAKLAKGKLLLKGGSINRIALPTLLILTGKNNHQKTKRAEIIEAITRLLKPID